MTPVLSPNTQAILLLTAPLIAGRSTSTTDLLSPGEYKQLARYLREIKCQPADLVSPDASDVLRACRSVIDEGRLQRLLGRGFLLSQVIERWQTRALWVVSRADADYPRRLKVRLREDAPAVLYGCGNIRLLETGGLAVVGSRHVDESLIDYTMAVGKLSALAGRTLISGGAKGIDQAAMRGALEAGGNVSGVLADSLEKTSMNREHRNLLMDGQLVLISPYDPSAGFNVGNAMQRNKLIYALADASLVVSSDFNKGGTWAGATEQLDKFKFVPVYVRSTGESSNGLDALLKKGAISWTNPQNVDEFEQLVCAAIHTGQAAPRNDPALFSNDEQHDNIVIPPETADSTTASKTVTQPLLPVTPIKGKQPLLQNPVEPPSPDLETKQNTAAQAICMPADTLFAVVRELIQQLLKVPMKDVDIAAALGVSSGQTKAWLQRLIEEGVIQKQKKPAGYIVKQNNLFDQADS